MSYTIDEIQEILNGNADGWTEVFESEWDDDGKYQHQTVVMAHENVNHLFTITRSGSYFSHYDYQYHYEGIAKRNFEVREFWSTVDYNNYVVIGGFESLVDVDEYMMSIVNKCAPDDEFTGDLILAGKYINHPEE